jgi:hypothetical protein
VTLAEIPNQLQLHRESLLASKGREVNSHDVTFILHFAANHNEIKQLKGIRICQIVALEHQLPHIAGIKCRESVKRIINSKTIELLFVNCLRTA